MVRYERAGVAAWCADALLVLGIVLALLPWRAAAADIESYRVRIEPDFTAKSIAGSTRVLIARSATDSRRLSFALHRLTPTAVHVQGREVAYDTDQDTLSFDIPPDLANRKRVRLDIDYRGRPEQGLVFGPDYVYSVWGPCHWMICDDAPREKATFELELLVPAHYRAIASGDAVSVDRAPGGLMRHRWQQRTAYSSYLFGFAAGKFSYVEEKSGGMRLLAYGIVDDPEALRAKFSPTAAMLDFFRSKAGVKLPQATYSQLLVPGGEAQEFSSFSVIGKQNLDPILQDPAADWVIAHELAHQWWGNLLTCKTWRDFWLNEGITVFMTAAYKQHRWGDAAYAREMEVARKRWQVAIDAGFDKPLTFDGTYPSLSIKRAIVYSKGALFMDALREEVGEQIFWTGLREYTRGHAGRSVQSADFQRAMESAADRKLDALFDAWVY